MTDDSASKSSDLLDLTARLKSSIKEFQSLLGRYDSQGRAQIETVVERLSQLTDPDLHHSIKFVAAAEALGSELRNFDNLKIELMSTVGFVGYAISTLVHSLETRYRASLGGVRSSISDDTSPINNVKQYLQDLKDVNKTGSETLTAIAELAGSQAIDSFDAATDILNLRLLFINKLLDETRPPEQVIGSQGKSYRIVPLRDAAVTEVIFSAGEEALKRFPEVVAGQVLLIGALVSVLKIVRDTREKQRSRDEQRALWQQIINAPSQRNLAEMAWDGLDIIRADDEKLRDLFNSQSVLANQLLIIAGSFPKTL